MKNKRLISAVTALVMMGIPAATNISCFYAPAAVTACAEAADSKEQHIWDGTADTSWYYREHNVVTTQNGDETQQLHIFSISTPEELAGLAALVRNGNTMENTVINLTEDIQLNDVSDCANWDTNPPANNWTAIGAQPDCAPGVDKCKEFKGIFNGNGHTVSGMYSYNYNFAGLFGNVSGMVSGLNVKDSYVKAVNVSNGFKGKETSNYNFYPIDTCAGGIAARACYGSVIANCEFDGKVYANGSCKNGYGTHGAFAGGIVGMYAGDFGGFLNKIAGMFVFGGVLVIYGVPVYIIPDDVFTAWGGVYNCVNHGEVICENGTDFTNGAGGIIGSETIASGAQGNSTLVIKNCFSDGKISRSDKDYGAIVGNHAPTHFIAHNFAEVNCYYTNCDNSSFHNKGVNYTEAGMTVQEVADKLGDGFKCEGGMIHLAFDNGTTDPTDSETTSDESVTVTTETYTDENTLPVNVTMPAIEISGGVTMRNFGTVAVPDSVTVSCERPDGVVVLDYELAGDPDFTDVYCIDTKPIGIKYEQLSYGKTYYVRARGRSREDRNDPACNYTEWSYISFTLEDPNPKGIKGDISGDGTVNVSDISMLAAHVKGIKKLSDAAAADLNGDGNVNVTDISMLAAHVKGIKKLG
ncbi:dockerin type I repeat-containing protein [uncultured Ruminococcus sp.]|uniref:dockerin type I repeat-containing protein n=1 Tax=uncultured Ruminococcus sp. TaxID=165186 RepID=UPI0025F888BB|nr:dockerin type I repeat-containing protein [uncultured Ruminococcus sp.]